MTLVKCSKSYSRHVLRLHALIIGACVLGGVSSVMAADDVQPAKPNAAESKTTAAESKTTAAAAGAPEVTYQNLASLSLGGTFVDGDKGQFGQRMQIPAGVMFGGVDALRYQKTINKQTSFSLDGRGIVDNHDYKLDLQLADPDTGYIKAGYEEFRTWYDGSGGYLPKTDTWIKPDDESLALDRGNAWIEGGLTLPDLPVLTLRYDHQFRDGKKDSTSWGDETTKGLRRSIVPMLWNIDERRDIVAGDIKDTLGNTDLGLGVRYERDTLDDSRDVARGVLTTSQRYTTQKENDVTDILDAHAFTDTSFNKKYRFTTGYLISSLKSDIGGSRIFGSSYDAAFNPKFSKRQYHDEGYYDLQGGSSEKQYVMNMNLMANPWDGLTITPSARIEKKNIDGDSRFMESNVGAAPKLTTSLEDLQAFNQRGLVEVSEQLEARYTGIRNWVLYLAGDWSQGDGNYSNHTEDYDTKKITDPGVNADDTAYVQKYTAGATWYALKSLSLASQYYHKIRDNNYKNYGVLSGLDSDTDDVNVRATWRPLNSVTLVGRYDLQLANVYQSAAEENGDHKSADIKTHIVGATFTWTPVERLYLQSSANYAFDRMTTPADDATGAAANIVTESRNDYFNFSQLVGYALDQKTDLQVQYSFYRANDFLDNSSSSVAYGAGETENIVTATLKHDLTDRMQVALKYGYFANRDKASGGNNDYNAQLVMSTLQYRF